MEEMVNTFIPRLDWARRGHLVQKCGVLQSSDNQPNTAKVAWLVSVKVTAHHLIMLHQIS